MSKHGQEYNENLTQKEMFEMGRKYEREQMAEHSEVEGLVLELGRGTKVTLYTGLTLEKRHLEMIDQALTTHGAKEYKRGVRKACDLYDIDISTKENIAYVLSLPQTDVTKN